MQLKYNRVVVAIGAALVFGACNTDDVTSTAPFLRALTAMLTPGAEVPPVTATSSGTSNITVITERNVSTGKIDTNVVRIQTLVTAIDSVTQAHIHAGAADVAGPIMVFLTPTYALVRGQRVARRLPDSSTTLTGVLTHIDITRGITAFTGVFTFDSLLTRINNGTAYVNVHTRRLPGGEIRGQIQ